MELYLEGEHFVPDALAAVAVGEKLGVAPEKIRQALAEFQNMAGRQEIFQAEGFRIIKDCYNAGPASMAAALKVLSRREGRKIAVLGDMLELGDCAPGEHYKLGGTAAKIADGVFVYGPFGPKVVEGAKDAGMENAWAFTDHSDLAAALKPWAKPGDTILFKGSRGMHMEISLEKFLNKEK